jgi:hypothetical protein
MMQDWKIESIAKVIVNITANWNLDKSNKEDSRLGRLIRKITVDWDPQYLAHLVSLLFSSHPLCNKDDEASKEYKEIFLKVLSKRWKFCRLSQFFICLGNKGTINHKLKMHLLQRAAKYEDSSKKMNFNFSNQRRKPVVMATPQTQPFLHQPQPQFQVISQSQSVDNLFQQNIQNQSPQLYQTVMILSPRSVAQGSPRSTPGQSPHTTFYQIQDYQRPIFSQSPFNDTISIASSSNSPASTSTSPPTFCNSPIPVITTATTTTTNINSSTTNIPMVTIRSMNQIMTMNTQPVPVVMSPPLNNYHSNSPPVIISNIAVPSTPTNGETFIRLPQGTSVIQAISPQGTPIQASNVITITTPITTTTNKVEPNRDSIFLSQSATSSTTTSRASTPNIDNTTNQINSPLSSSDHSKLKGKETNEEDKSTNVSPPTYQPNSVTRQSLLFMTPSNTSNINSINNSNAHPQTLAQPQITNNTTSVNDSVSIPLSLNLRSINQRITELSKSSENIKEIPKEEMTSYSTNQIETNQSVLKLVSSSNHPTKEDQMMKNDSNLKVKTEKEFSSSSSTSQNSSTKNVPKGQGKLEENIDKENPTETLKEETSSSSSSPRLSSGEKKTNEYYEEIFNLDEFNHEEKKAIYDIIDSSNEDLDKIQMEKDEKIRNFIQENNKEFSNQSSSSSSPKTPPPSLSSSPYFQK